MEHVDYSTKLRKPALYLNSDTGSISGLTLQEVESWGSSNATKGRIQNLLFGKIWTMKGARINYLLSDRRLRSKCGFVPETRFLVNFIMTCSRGLPAL